MASRGFFGYDPYDDFYSPYQHSYRRPSPARDDFSSFFPPADYLEPTMRRAAAPISRPGRAARDQYGFFPSDDYEEPTRRAAAPSSRAGSRPASARDDYDMFGPDLFSAFRRPQPTRRAAAAHPPPTSECFEIPVTGPDPEPKREAAGTRVPPPVAAPKKPAPSADEAAAKVQAAARGFMARKMMREVRAVEREAEGVAARLAAEAEALRGDARARIAVGEGLMRLLLRLDAVRGVREYRRKVTKRVLALQDAVDALESKPAPAPVTESNTPEAASEDALPAETIEMAGDQTAEESDAVPGSPHAAEQSAEIEAESEVVEPAAEIVAEPAAEMEVDGGKATAAEAHPEETVVDGENTADESEGDWEMVAEESASDCDAVPSGNSVVIAPQQEPAGEEMKTETAATDVLDAKKVMQMVAALCEQSSQQCAVIGALAERVDALERSVRRMEEADRRRRRNKKLKKEAKGNSKAARSCYSD